MTGIPRELLLEIRDRNDIYDLVSDYVQLKKSGGGYYKGLCPFHSEKTPSFTVTPSKQIFKCFGCGESGDSISFIMKIENLEFIEAVHFLAQRANIEIRLSEEEDRQVKRRRSLLSINRDAARAYHRLLVSSPDNPGLLYLRKRGLSDSLIRTYGLGYAPPQWSYITDELISRGYDAKELAELGLSIRGKKGNYYDRFRDRIMFPIIDISGAVIGFGGRTLSGEGAKYLNSPESYIFKKSENLFSLNFAKEQKSDTLILAEGYMDVIGLYGAGFKNAAASLGTSLTSAQARLASRFFKKVVIAYDSDGAGRAASSKALNIFSDLAVDVKVINMGDKKDPDEFINEYGPLAFAKLMDESQNYIDYQLFSLELKYDKEVPEEKVRYLRGAAGIISKLRSPLERDVYISRLSEQHGVSRESVKTEVDRLIFLSKKQAERKRRQELLPYGSKDASKDDKPTVTRSIIGILYDDISLFGKIESRISSGDFDDDAEADIFEYFSRMYKDGLEPDVSLAHTHLSPDRVRRLASIVGSKRDFPRKRDVLFDLVGNLESRRLWLDTISDESSGEEWFELMRQKKSAQKDGEKKNGG